MLAMYMITGQQRLEQLSEKLRHNAKYPCMQGCYSNMSIPHMSIIIARKAASREVELQGHLRHNAIVPVHVYVHRVAMYPMYEYIIARKAAARPLSLHLLLGNRGWSS